MMRPAARCHPADQLAIAVYAFMHDDIRIGHVDLERRHALLESVVALAHQRGFADEVGLAEVDEPIEPAFEGGNLKTQSSG